MPEPNTREEQSHTTQADWTPDITPALYTKVAEPGEIPVWRQPTGAQMEGGRSMIKKWLESLPDWQKRSLKTFAQTFGGIVIPELTMILSGGWPESWAKFWGVLAPVISSALAAAICAVWNILLEQLKSKEVSTND